MKAGSARLAASRVGANMGGEASPVKSPDIEGYPVGYDFVSKVLRNAS